MITQLANWVGNVEINGVSYDSIADVPNEAIVTGVTIVLNPIQKVQAVQKVHSFDDKDVEHIITVKKYMTMPATSDFDFMDKWNNGIPMPLRTMVGTIEKETKGMVYANLHGDITATRMCTCMKCGRPLTNPISQYVGLGPECGNIIHMSLTESDYKNIEQTTKIAKERLLHISWSGWIIRSSILEDRLING